MDSGILILYHFHTTQNIILILILLHIFKNVETVLSSQTTQKQVVSQTGPTGHGLPTLDLGSRNLQDAPIISKVTFLGWDTSCSREFEGPLVQSPWC